MAGRPYAWRAVDPASYSEGRLVMARVKRSRCECGCGQASSTTCRQRLLECDGCPVKVRMSRTAIESVTLSCSCGGQYAPVCLIDRAQAGDDAAWTEFMGRFTVSGVQADRGRLGAAATNRKRRAERERERVNATAGRDALPF